jgi:hypothetical protein
MSKSLRKIAAFSGFVLGACGNANNPPQTGAKLLACPGQQVVMATNDWNEAVEIFANTDSAQPMLLGRLNPTEHVEFVLPAGTNAVKPVPARAIRPSYDPPGMLQLVRFRYTCR